MTTRHTIAEIVRHRAEIQRESAAYTFLRDGESEAMKLDWGTLDLESRALGAMLQEWRITRPLLIYAPGLDFVVSFFACLYAGVTPVPAGLPPAGRMGRSMTRLCAVARDAGADAVLSTSRLIERALGDPALAEHAPDLARLRWLSTETPGLELVECWRDPLPKEGAPAFIQYTSGSTSTPKGVVVTHQSLLHNLAACNEVEQNTRDSVSVSWLPHSHDMGLIESILLPAFIGYRAYLMSPASFLARPARWLEAISRFRATNSGGPNFAYDLCTDKVSLDEEQNLDLSSWTTAYNGSETVRGDTLCRFRERFGPRGFHWNAFRPVYGLAESTLLVTGERDVPPVFREVDANALSRGVIQDVVPRGGKTVSLVSCGRPATGARIVIADPDTLALRPPGAVGEVWVSSPSVAAGYWRREDETLRVFHARLEDTGEGPFLRTGDLGFCEDGRLFVTGRVKDVINIRGFKHYPQDIELTMASSHDAIHSDGCAAFALNHDGVEQLAVIAEVRPRFQKRAGGWQDCVISAIQASVAERHGLQIHAVALVRYGTIPKTTSGKLKRYACRNAFVDGSLQALRVWSIAV